MKRLILITALFAPHLVATADIYRCDIDGELIFSQVPCSDNAEKLQLQVYTPEVSAEDSSATEGTTEAEPQGESFLERKRMERQVSSLEKERDKLTSQRDKELDALRKRLQRVSSQLEGAELQLKAVDVQNSYNSKIADITRKLRELRSAKP